MHKPNLATLAISARRPAHRGVVEAGNVIFTEGIIAFLSQLWTAGVPQTSIQGWPWPWRVPSGYANPTRYGSAYSGYYAAGNPGDKPYYATTLSPMALGTVDAFRARLSGTASLTAGAAPVVIGGMTVSMGGPGTTGAYSMISAVAHTDIPTTQVGPLYGHAVRGAYTATTNIGTAYLTAPSNNYLRDAGRVAHGGAVVRITTVGLDRGTYILRWYDVANTRLYLMNMDGTPFVAQTGTTVSFTVGVRLTFFNEAGDSPVSTGTITIGGSYQDPNRESYVLRVRPEKSGNTTAGYTQGSYWFSIRPWTCWSGVYGAVGEDVGAMVDNRIRFNAGTAGNDNRGMRQDVGAGFVGGIPGMALDRTNQRLWLCSTNNTNGNIMWWRYKCPETYREVASSTTLAYSGYAIAGITLTGGVPRALDIGSDEAVYVAVYNGTYSGWIRIASDLTAVQTLSSAVGKGANNLTNGLAVDRSRARAVTNTITTTAGTGKQQVTVVGAAFTARDVGRVITIAGLANDNGTYRIASYIDATNITVETAVAGTAPNGGSNVTFVGVSASGTMTVGDRIYLFWNDATSEGASTLTYMESLLWGTLLVTAALTKTNGRTLYNGQRPGSAPPCAVDQKTGILWWASSDTTAQVNRFDPSGTTVNNKALSTFTAAGSGRGTGSGTCTVPTLVNSIGCNPHSAFDEVWLGTDNGHVQMTSPSTNITSYERYFGSAATDYNAPTGYFRPDGSMATAGINLRNINRYAFGPDGRVFGLANVTSTTSGAPEYLQFNRSNGLWTTGNSFGSNSENFSSETYNYALYGDGMGRIIYACPTDGNAGYANLSLLGVEVHYQWLGGAWTPQEIVRGTLPDATSSPGLTCKPIHSTTDALLWGTTISFTPQGGATPANREFIGVVGQVTAQQNDGATSIGTNNFTGSGFVSGDVGRYLRIESGADVGVYVVASYVGATQVTLKRLNGTAWTAAATAGTLNYTKWEMSEDSFPGPECSSFYLASGFGKDTNQTIDNVICDVFLTKTTLSISAEAKKPCVNFLGAPGATAPAAYMDTYAIATNPNYNPALGGHVALPAALTNGTMLLDGILQKLTDGTNGRPSATLVSNGGTWSGRAADGKVAGSALTVDLGAEVEVGTVIFRAALNVSSGSLFELGHTDTQNTIGSIAHLWKTTATPVAASSVRTSGVANLSCANGTTLPLPTLSVSSGDLLGSLTTSNTDGTTTQNDNRFDATSAPFTSAHVGQVLKILGGADVGSYRITSVDAGGTYCRVRALNQTAVSFVATASALSWEIRDAVREDDMIAVPNVGAPTHKLCIERLLTPTTAQVRIAPHTSLSSVSWDAVKPSWDLVKRCSYSTQAVAPEVANNGTYVAHDALEGATQFTGSYAMKYAFGLSDLSAAARTGRYWKLALMPRFTSGNITYPIYWRSAEFYDTSGTRIGVVSLVDSATNPQFFAAHVTRVDFILGNDSGSSHVVGANGLVTIAAGGTSATLAGANVWLGRQVRPLGTAGSIAGSSNVFTGNASDPQFVDSDTGRILRITTGVNAGYYRISLVSSGTSVNLTRPDGSAVTLTADAGPVSYAVHEGPAANATTPDYLAITTGGVLSTNVEFTITGVSADLKTLTLAESPGTAISGQPWELRRRAVSSTATATDAASSARLLDPANAYPRQSGDVVAGARGTLAFWSNDVGGAYIRSDGQTNVGVGTFNGSAFTPDDVGSLLVITSGADQGAYRISAYTSATQITVVNAYTGAAVSFSTTSAANLTYVIRGERHYRIARYATGLRQ